MKRILLVLAHPDDESFACGGTVAKYVDAGFRADLICTTRGEAGGGGPFGDISGTALGDIRQKELELAASILGISTITFLGYKDGTLHDEPPGEIEDAVFRKMIEMVPDYVITFDTTGISNHPDHIKICFSATYAFQKYASWVIDIMKRRGNADEGLLPKLYYVSMPESVATFLKKKKNIPEESFGRPWQGIEDKRITTVINIERYRSIKKKALRAHASQTSDVERFLSLARHPLLTYEYFILRMHGLQEVFMGKNDRFANRL